MSKFRAAIERGMIARNRLETEALARRRAILDNPDPVMVEKAKKWVYGVLPDTLERVTLWGGEAASGVQLYDVETDVPSEYLYYVCKGIPDLVVTETQEIVGDWNTGEKSMHFTYTVSVRYTDA